MMCEMWQPQKEVDCPIWVVAPQKKKKDNNNNNNSNGGGSGSGSCGGDGVLNTKVRFFLIELYHCLIYFIYVLYALKVTMHCVFYPPLM